MKQCCGSPVDIVHRHSPLFILVTVTEMSVQVALADLFWPQAMWNIFWKKPRDRDQALRPKSSASANSAILASLFVSSA